MNTALRKKTNELIIAGDFVAASRCLAEIWREEAGPATAPFINSCYEKMREQLPIEPYRLAILRSFTVEPLTPLLRAACFQIGIDLTVHLGEFNAYAQEILDADSSFYQFGADAVILAVQTRDLAPGLWRDYADLNLDEEDKSVEGIVNSFRDWVFAFRKRSRSHLIIHSLEEPAVSSRGVFDGQSEGGQRAAIRRINQELHRLAAEQSGVFVLDYDALVARHGRAQWPDERKWLTVRMPIAAKNLGHMINEWLRFLHPLTGKVAKALVVDLDNTLWGGVIGEDGMAGIEIGPEYPGAAYQALQRAMLDLHRRGILLCICSKNNPDDAIDVLEKHPDMLLRLSHFAAVRINWNDKEQGLREIAAELNIGTDALAFLDDNPVERERIYTEMPEVTVIDLPPDPMQFAQALRDSPVFERLTISTEDEERGTYYTAQRGRVEMERSCSTREDFYRHLQQEALIAPVTTLTLRRVAQLTQKTNQFNLTTRRYTEQQIAEMVQRPDWHVYSLRVRDRFGDNGLVGVAIAQHKGALWELDTFLLSCRVIGRTMETALLAHLIEQARAYGADQLQGWFLPTGKNVPAESFYRDHGFSLVNENENGSRWVLSLSEESIRCPEWIRLVVVNGETD